MGSKSKSPPLEVPTTFEQCIGQGEDHYDVIKRYGLRTWAIGDRREAQPRLGDFDHSQDHFFDVLATVYLGRKVKNIEYMEGLFPFPNLDRDPNDQTLTTR